MTEHKCKCGNGESEDEFDATKIKELFGLMNVKSVEEAITAIELIDPLINNVIKLVIWSDTNPIKFECKSFKDTQTANAIFAAIDVSTHDYLKVTDEILKERRKVKKITPEAFEEMVTDAEVEEPEKVLPKMVTIENNVPED